MHYEFDFDTEVGEFGCKAHSNYPFLRASPDGINIDETNKYKIIHHICQYISYFHTLHEHEIELVFFTNELIRTVNSN